MLLLLTSSPPKELQNLGNPGHECRGRRCLSALTNLGYQRAARNSFGTVEKNGKGSSFDDVPANSGSAVEMARHF